MRITGSIAAATLALALLAGCGSPAQTPSGQATQPAASPTDAAPAPSETTTAPDGGSNVSADEFLQRVSGVEMKTYTMEMEMSTAVEGAPMEMTMTGSFDGSDAATPRSHLKMNVSGMEIEMIMVEGDAFMKMALLGEDWIKMDPEDAAEMTGGSSPDIGQWTEDYAKNLEKVELIGEEDLNGLAVRHYRLTLKPEALKGLGVEDVGFETTDVAFDVWIDGDGFTRKFAMDMAGDVPVSMTATLDDINEPVTIEAPKDWVEMPS